MIYFMVAIILFVLILGLPRDDGDPPPTDPPPTDPPTDPPPADPPPTMDQIKQLVQLENDYTGLKKEHSTATGRLTDLEKELEALRSDPIAGFKKLGGDPDLFLRRIANDDEPDLDEKFNTANQALMERIDKLEKVIETKDQQAQQQAQQNQLSEYVGTMQKTWIDAEDKESWLPVEHTLSLFEALEGMPRDQALMGAVNAHLNSPEVKESGKVLTPAESAATLLTESTARLDSFVAAVKSNEVLKTWLLEKLSAEVQPDPELDPKPSGQTLTNADTANSTPVDKNKLTHEERIALMAKKLDAQRAEN